MQRIFVESAVGLTAIGKGSGHTYFDTTDNPFPSVTMRPVKFYVTEINGGGVTDSMDKPPYRVPLMTEIAQVPWNGFKAISTFSGAGGSSLGYKMAGFKVLWASEFVAAAQEVYRLNHPDTILDTRDIRQVTTDDILKAIGMVSGELDLMDGSPPCASFSTAGKREAGWGKVKKYSDTVQRTDDLFFEFARLVKGIQPKVFVAENVSGLVKGKAKGYFLEILKALKDCGYNVKSKLLDAQWLGVPQMRQRIIFIGVRNDLGLDPAFPLPLPYRYSVKEALPWIATIGTPSHFGHSEQIPAQSQPYHTVGTGPQQGNGLARFVEVEAEVQAARVIHDTGGLYSMGDVTDKPSPTIDTNPRLFVEPAIGTHKGERSIDEPAPSVLTHGRQYTTSELTLVERETDISRYAIGREWDNTEQGKANDRYFSLKKAELAGPSFGISAEGGNTSLAGVTHPTERRKFSIAELKRICAFPDDFILTGSYAQMWERLGRAVPPVMMSWIAKTIKTEILERLDR